MKDLKTVTRKELVDEVSDKTRLNKELVRDVFNLFLARIKEHFRNGRRIELRGFGVFYPHKIKSRKVTVPRTREVIETSERVQMKFRMGKNTD